MTRTVVFAREQLRAPFTLALLVAIPALFVISAAGVLSEFASALGGSLAGDAAAALSAGWAAAFISGALGFFQAASSRGADRRLALAGLGPARVASSRIAASVGLAVVAAAAMGTGSPTGDWVKLVIVTAGALVAAFLVFVAPARSRA